MPPAPRRLAAGPCTGAALPPAPRGLAAGPCTGAALLLVGLALVLTACAGQGGSPTGPASPGTSSAARDELAVEIDRGDGSPVERYTLTCGPEPGGDHPAAAAACARLAGLEDPFAPIPGDVACTEVYGGPQTARVTGTWQGRPVDLRLSRTDGCRIDQWNRLGPLLPGPVGVGDELPD
ncbi:SSI family serine proteinase inhibitor [Blastococcus sp. SYSU D00820]